MLTQEHGLSVEDVGGRWIIGILTSYRLHPTPVVDPHHYWGYACEPDGAIGSEHHGDAGGGRRLPVSGVATPALGPANDAGLHTKGRHHVQNHRKNMSPGGWIVVGILIAMMLVPSGVAVAKALRYTGIEGTSLNKADVTPAGQLLTTEASPKKYEDYEGVVASALGGTDCETVGSAIPAGESFVAQQVEMDINQADTSVAESPTSNSSTSGFAVSCREAQQAARLASSRS